MEHALWLHHLCGLFWSLHGGSLQARWPVEHPTPPASYLGSPFHFLMVHTKPEAKGGSSWIRDSEYKGFKGTCGDKAPPYNANS